MVAALQEIDRAAIVAQARLWVGTPYHHQASLRGVGCDCLGLIRGVWRHLLGSEPVDLPNYTSDWAEVAGEEPLLDGFSGVFDAASLELARGQVVIFRMRADAVAKHLAIISEVTSPKIIHAFSSRGVIETPMSDVWIPKIAGRFEFPHRRP